MQLNPNATTHSLDSFNICLSLWVATSNCNDRLTTLQLANDPFSYSCRDHMTLFPNHYHLFLSSTIWSTLLSHLKWTIPTFSWKRTMTPPISCLWAKYLWAFDPLIIRFGHRTELEEANTGVLNCYQPEERSRLPRTSSATFCTTLEFPGT